MINLTKFPKPQILIDNEVSWTDALMGFVMVGQKIPSSIQGHYKHVEIKNSIKLETAGKCMYCESYITHVYPGDVEHIIPKSVFPSLTFNWENLSLACSICNNKKRDYYDPNLPLLNPYVDTVNEHVRLFGPLLMHINDSRRGEATLKIIQLNRHELRERRLEVLQEFQTLLDKYNRETLSGLKHILKQEIFDQISPDKEYSKLKHQYLMDSNIVL